MNKIISLLLIFCLSCACQEQTVYYVSPSGSDRSAGDNRQDALQTIQEAVNRSQPGDTVIVLPGDYPERVIVQQNGSAGNPLTLVSLEERKARINGGFELRGNHIRLMGFQIENRLRGWPERHAVFISGNHIVVADNYFLETGHAALRGNWKTMPRFVEISGNKFYRCQAGIHIEGQAWLVENNDIERLVDHGNGDCDYMRFFGSDHTIRNNHLHGSRQAEIGTAHVDCFQTFDNDGKYARNVVIEGNRCSEFMQGFMGEAHAGNKSGNIRFKNNIFANGFPDNSHGMIIQDIPRVMVLNNLFYNIRHRGVAVQAADFGRATDALLFNNIFYKCGTSYSFFEPRSRGDYNLSFETRNNPNRGAHDMINIDPLLIDPPNGNFRPKAGSPLIGAGFDILRELSGHTQPDQSDSPVNIGPAFRAP